MVSSHNWLHYTVIIMLLQHNRLVVVFFWSLSLSPVTWYKWLFLQGLHAVERARKCPQLSQWEFDNATAVLVDPRQEWPHGSQLAVSISGRARPAVGSPTAMSGGQGTGELPALTARCVNTLPLRTHTPIHTTLQWLYKIRRPSIAAMLTRPQNYAQYLIRLKACTGCINSIN